MSDPTRDPLDQVIDRVAARMVSVDHDEAMADRIVARLPERSGLGGWSRVLLPQAAVAGALIVAALVWTTRNRERVVPNPVTVPSRAEAGVAAREVPAVPAVPATAADVNAPIQAAGMVVRRVTPAAAPLPADHERSLAPVGEPKPLEVVSLASPSLPEEAFVVLAPIVLTELPLSGESISPQK
jgi:hypothetical protein